MPDQTTITLEDRLWKALLGAVPQDVMTYTPAGQEIFAAYQAIDHAINDKEGTDALS